MYNFLKQNRIISLAFPSCINIKLTTTTRQHHWTNTPQTPPKSPHRPYIRYVTLWCHGSGHVVITSFDLQQRLLETSRSPWLAAMHILMLKQDIMSKTADIIWIIFFLKGFVFVYPLVVGFLSIVKTGCFTLSLSFSPSPPPSPLPSPPLSVSYSHRVT